MRFIGPASRVAYETHARMPRSGTRVHVTAWGTCKERLRVSQNVEKKAACGGFVRNLKRDDTNPCST